MKKISIVKPGAGENAQSEVVDMAIQPGNTGKQVMEQLQLTDYSLNDTIGKPIDMAQDLYSLVDNGQKLFATTKADVGC